MRRLELATLAAIGLTMAALLMPPAIGAQQPTTTALAVAAAPQAAAVEDVQRNYAGAIEADEHTLFALAVEADLPPGVEVVSAVWRVPDAIDYRTTNALGTEAIATGRPSPIVDGVPVPHKVEYQAQAAQVGFVEVELPDGTKQKKKVAFLPFVTISQTWQVTITGRGPPPVIDPEEEEPKPKPEGPKASVLIYEPTGGPPSYAAAATNDLRQAGEVVFFVSAEAKTGDGATPGFLASAIQKGKEVGLPALVIMAGSEVVSAAPMPSTKAGIVEAVTEGS